MTVAEVSRMPKVTLYVRDADAPVWEKARHLAGDSLSSIVSRALAAYVDEEETRARAKNAIERDAVSITLDVQPDDERPRRKVRFTGVLAHEGEESHSYADAYVTTSGKVILAIQIPSMVGLRTDRVVVYESFDDFAASANPHLETKAAVAEILGEEMIEEIE